MLDMIYLKQKPQILFIVKKEVDMNTCTPNVSIQISLDFFFYRKDDVLLESV